MSKKQDSYTQILRSSSIVGGSQIVRMAIGVIQLKFVAILLGPAGVGLIGAFQSITQLVNQISGLGLSKSGVREVAAAVHSDNQNNVGSTIYVLNRMCWFTGIIGTAFLILLALPISQITFGDDEHRTALITISCVVIITAVAQGKLAIIQGLRRIKDLVKVQMFGSLLGTLCSIPMYIFWGMEGIVPSLLLIALSNLLFAWWYSKQAKYEYIFLDWRDVVDKTRRMLGLGAAFMIGALAATLSIYITRSLIIRDLGMDALGIHQAAFVISGYSLNFVLGAMGADFYPRLAGVSNDNCEMCKLVNEQTVIGLLLATPVLIAILGLAGWIVNILYSIEFYPATELLRWFVLGCYMRVISWPMGYVQIAKGAKYWFLFSQISFNIVQLVMIYIGLLYGGLTGISIAFFIFYLLHVLSIRLLVRHLINFKWDKVTSSLITIQLIIVSIVFLLTQLLSAKSSGILCCFIFLFMTIYSITQLARHLGDENSIIKYLYRIPLVRKLLKLNFLNSSSG